MIYYHGTNESNYNSIMKDGFKIIESDKINRFGNGIYFSNNFDVSYYGNNIIEVNLNLNALHLTIEQWYNIETGLIRKYGNEYHKHIADYGTQFRL